MSADAAESIAPPGYVLGDKLGEGGFGQVFRAHHTLMGRDVAIKVLHLRYSAEPEAIARFIAEARAVARISHPGIVEAFEFGTLADGRQFCVMELVRGSTLREVLRERKRLPLDEALPILRAIAEAVDAAHAAGVAHRDLKPDNVFVLEDGGVKLIDFGLAKLVDDAQAPVTATGSMFGTPLYMSPEQCRGRTDARTDLYSFGAMAFHVLTGAAPFSGSPLELALHHLNDPPPRASSVCAELPARVDRVLDALLAKSPEARPSPLVTAVDALAGTTELARPRRRAWLAVPILGAGAIAAIVMWPHDSVPAADCESGESRVATAWDPARRDALVAHFATVVRPDVAATSRLLAQDFDTFAGDWVKQWNAACVAPDRASAPLIHAQRQNCLERALIDFTAITDAARDADPASFSLSTNGALFAWVTPLADCERDETLRAMPPAPAREHVAEVTQLIRGLHTARARARAVLNGELGGTLDGPLGELDHVIERLDALGSATAAEAAMIHTWYASSPATYDRTRLEAAHRSLDRAIALGRKYRYDQILVDDYHLAIGLERSFGRSLPKLRELYDRADEAYERAGRPAFALDAWPGRAELAILEGDLDGALGQLAQAVARPHFPLSHTYISEQRSEVMYARLAIYLGHADEGLTYARGQLAKTIAAWGPDHRAVMAARVLFASLLQMAGRDREALDELAVAGAIAVRIGATANRRGLIEQEVIVSADRLGLTAERDAAIARLAALPGVPWNELATKLDRTGRFALEKSIRARSRSPDAPLNDALVALQLDGSNEALAILDREHVPNSPATQLIHAIANARAGKNVDAYLAASAATYATADEAALSAMDLDAYLLLEMRRWREARDLLARARTLASRLLPDINDTVSELDSGDGQALLGLGDAAAARPLLDRALFAMDSHAVNALDVPDTAFALAQAIVATHGDGARARSLAQRAIDGYPPFRKHDRDAAIAWVAALPSR